MQHRALLLPAAAMFLAAAYACSAGDPGGGGPAATPGIHFLSGDGAADSIEAAVPDLVVEVRDAAGAPAVGVQVQFQAPIPVNLGDGAVRITEPGTIQFRGSVTQPTDSRGRASVAVRLWDYAGRAPLVVIANGQTDTAWYQVRPGAAARLIAVSRDTALRAGGTWALRARVRDRVGNPRDDVATFSSPTSHLAVTGETLTAVDVGRWFALARFGGLEDTAWVSVVPPGRLGGYDAPVSTEGTAHPARLVLFDLDGRDVHTLPPPSPALNPDIFPPGMAPRFTPSRDALLFVNGTELWRADTAGVSSRVLAGSPAVINQHTPEMPADGSWIYYTRGTYSGTPTCWRVHPDGSGEEAIALPDQAGCVGPSPEPSGGRVAYERRYNSEGTIHVRTLATGADVELATGRNPRWSPLGTWIAYQTGEGMRMMHPDGTQDHLVGGGIRADAWYTWSPDEAWIAFTGPLPARDAPYARGISLVRVATGDVLPLRFTGNYSQPSWR